jgi:hypothetical protein
VNEKTAKLASYVAFTDIEKGMKSRCGTQIAGLNRSPERLKKM